MRIKRIVGSLWVWVIAAFVAVILAWFWTVRIANNYDFKSLPEGETLERQPPVAPNPGP